MFKVFDQQRIERTRQMLRSEQLHKLKFSEAFHNTLFMMALLIDMTASFSSPSEFRRLPDHCESLPPYRRLNGEKKGKNPRKRP